MSKDVLTIHTDGGARGNPGPAAFAYVIAHEDVPIVEEGGRLGRSTNNKAEYTALVRALEHAQRLGTHYRLVIHSDSELMIKQMKGEYRVKDAGLRPLYEQATQLSKAFPHVTFRHVRREHNRRADELCNEALDGRREPSDLPPPTRPPTRPSTRPTISPRARALACLRNAAAQWAKGDPNQPAPEVVLREISEMLGEGERPAG